MVVGTCQGLIGRLLFDEPVEPCLIATQVLNDLPAPRNHTERLLLRAVLTDFSQRFVCHLHPVSMSRGACSCVVDAETTLMTSWRDSQSDPRESFLRWLQDFIHACALAHPPTRSEQAANALRAEVGRPFHIRDLARQLGCTSQALRKDFQRCYAMTPREYAHLARLVRLMPLVVAGSVKNEALASEAGYKSKKDFYKYFKQLTGMRPSELRRISREDADQLLLLARARLFQGLSPRVTRRVSAPHRHATVPAAKPR